MESTDRISNGADGWKGSWGDAVVKLSRWSYLNKPLPAVDKIASLHIYDFDNTLFRTPVPNSALWTATSIGMLHRQDAFINGGWWHDNRILGATGHGLDREEPLGWEGHWNEKVVRLVRSSIEKPDVLCVLLTGRGEEKFADLLCRIVASRHLGFDMLCLKPKLGPANQTFSSTMSFKQALLKDLIQTYWHSNELHIYEDRPAHAKKFRKFFDTYNTAPSLQPRRATIQAKVILVTDTQTTLDPTAELAEVQRMVNKHNEAMLGHSIPRPPKVLRITQNILSTSYMIAPTDSKKLLQLISSPGIRSGNGIRIHGDNIIIMPQQCQKDVLTKVGGLGSKMKWQVTGTSCYCNSIWAARLVPVPPTAIYHCDSPVPLVVLALKKSARAVDARNINTWVPLPLEKRFIFETTVREKTILSIEYGSPRKQPESTFTSDGGRPLDEVKLKHMLVEVNDSETHIRRKRRRAIGRSKNGEERAESM
ncbi:hypothetical protein PWT90_06883 [Aphanocladium album]|nr:hypothetical protein PWT90_06883 [Aphanocladium album]